MSTELKTNGKHGFYLTRHFGGNDRGVCVQVTTRAPYHEATYITIARDEALYLAADLIIFANELEQEDES